MTAARNAHPVTLPAMTDTAARPATDVEQEQAIQRLREADYALDDHDARRATLVRRRNAAIVGAADAGLTVPQIHRARGRDGSDSLIRSVLREHRAVAEALAFSHHRDVPPSR